MDDWKLLNDYAMKNSEEAFRTLVERYAGMVYHAALRQTGNPHAAEDVAQDVFIALAQKADSIPRQATLYGWLFRATRFAILNQVRKNVNRERREQAALVMQPTIESNEADSIWECITPHLNDALEKLSAADRELVLIRFFGNKSHKDLAEALGVSEETARKRISRAIERLRVIFARRGVVVSSLALVAAFAAHGAQAAPMEMAAAWAKVATAKAAAGTAAASGGILALATSAKSLGFIAVLTGSVVVAAAFIISKVAPHGSPVAQPLATHLTTSVATPDTNSPLAGPVTPSKPATDPGANAALAAALDEVKAALHDPNETTLYPNPVMQAAIAGLGDQKKEALPILEAALKEDANAEVRLRALDGLGIIGPEATEAAPLLLGMLRDGGVGQAIPQTRYTVMGKLGAVRSFPVYTDNMILYALGQIHPSPEILPEFARMVKENPSVSTIVYRATKQFPGVRRSMQAGGWLWAIANENAQALNNAFLPLLQDPDWQVRSVAALALVSALGDQADRGVFPVAAELLKSDDDNFLRAEGMSLLNGAARAAGSYDPTKEPTLTTARLGPYLNETLSALADAADHTTREDLRLAAAKMLDTLSPGFRKLNPLAAELEQQKQLDAFSSKVTSGVATMPEVLEGLKRFPQTAPAIAVYYARLTSSNGVELLPAFSEALSALAPSSDASSRDRTKAINARQRLADAMQKIAPKLPKPIFTATDTIAITLTMRDPAVQADPARLQKVSDACRLAEWPEYKSVGNFDVPPDEIRRLLAAMKAADAPTYDALVAKVKEIDPHFSDIAAGSAKEN